MKYILINYNFDPSWVREYTDDYLIYDRSDDGNDWVKDIPKDKLIKTENVGNVDYDRLSYLVDNYDNLPDIFLLAKSNLFKYITKEEFDRIKDIKVFHPLLTLNHKVYLPVCFYDENGIYNEINNSWYLSTVPAKYFSCYNDFAKSFRLPQPIYLPFAPGGNYILTRETVHKHGRDYYDQLREILPYCQLPGEAHFIERSYYNIWN